MANQTSSDHSLIGPAAKDLFTLISVRVPAKKDTPWSRRLKIPLRGITWNQIKKSRHLETRVPGTGKDGCPNCGATVKPFRGLAIGWITIYQPPVSIIFFNFSIGLFKDRLLFNKSAHRSPTSPIRFSIFRTLNDLGPTAPVSTSSHVHGAETGAPVFARTVYVAANVALYSFLPVST